jgi:heme exporter protein A
MLTAKNISFSRGSPALFSDLSFSVQKGERLAIKGANGSGKTTLLRILAGLILPSNNTLLWEGEMVSRSNLNLYQQNLLYLGHKLCLHPQARVADQFQLWKNLHNVPVTNIEEALDIWGISGFKDKRISHLSQGQQRRLTLSRCHWLKRSLWLLDEPEAGLDEEGQIILTNVLSDHLKGGGCIVHATHSTSASLAMTKKIIIARSISDKAIQCRKKTGLLHSDRNDDTLSANGQKNCYAESEFLL